MSVSFEIKSSASAYDVHVEKGIFDKIKADQSDMIVICDARFQAEFEAEGLRVIALEANESSKSLARMPEMIVKLRKFGASRSTTVIAVGGGIVQDAAAFCAGIYMRGMKWIYVPTTLLGMCDSCIGGKSSINVEDMKNIVGSFYPPERIYIDPSLCRTLSDEQWAAGLIEAAKICFARGGVAFSDFVEFSPSTHMAEDDLAKMIELSLRMKKWFIEVDEFDRNERLLLNFGHTFGHAVESASGFAVSHGIAVGLGCLAALSLARTMGVHVDAQPATLKYENFMLSCLAKVPLLERQLAGVRVSALMEAFEADKKHVGTAYKVVTVDSDGQTILLKLPKTAESRQLIQGAFRTMLEHVSLVEAAE